MDDMHRIATEHEKLGFQLDTLEPMSFDHIRKLLDGMASRFVYERVMEEEHVIGLQKVKHEIYLQLKVLNHSVLIASVIQITGPLFAKQAR